jgi:protein-S-isoprenylcysteine O-methyltransferase Ste14
MFAFYLVLMALGIAAGLHSAIRLAAIVLSLVCAGMWVAARRQLGGAFSVRPEARKLVKTGLYARLRHPIYVFGTAAFLLVLLALQGGQALIFWAILIPIQVIRARREDAVLAKTFGQQYEAYRQSTWF